MGEVNPGKLDAIPEDKVLPIFFADDSALARKKIVQVLDQMGLPHQQAHNGQEAWQRLQALATQAEQDGEPLRRRLGLVLVDAEMPEMDGYVLTRHIKADRRFEGIPVMMHSSLSSIANRKLGQQVGVDAYVAKFHFDELAGAITGMLRNRKEAA
jgi:two-component system chemotaxis response regulator CheV